MSLVVGANELEAREVFAMPWLVRHAVLLALGFTPCVCGCGTFKRRRPCRIKGGAS